MKAGKLIGVLLVCILSCQCIRVRGHTILTVEIPLSGEGFVKFDKAIAIPGEVIVRVETGSGFSSWDDVLDLYDEFEAELTLIRSDGEQSNFSLSLSSSDEDVSLIRHQRDDGNVELGWSLRNRMKEVIAVRIAILGEAKVKPNNFIFDTAP